MRINKMSSITEMYKSQSIAPVQKVKANQKDEVIFSPQALEIQNAHKAAKASPDVRAEKVAAIKEQIKSGTYTIDAKAVSEKIISRLDIKG
ncbi:MAG: flagellar biosynthesis anti-sigma factor FlgM [Cellulosilyticaceae bacterium]